MESWESVVDSEVLFAQWPSGKEEGRGKYFPGGMPEMWCLLTGDTHTHIHTHTGVSESLVFKGFLTFPCVGRNLQKTLPIGGFKTISKRLRNSSVAHMKALFSWSLCEGRHWQRLTCIVRQCHSQGLTLDLTQDASGLGWCQQSWLIYRYVCSLFMKWPFLKGPIRGLDPPLLIRN